MSRIKRLEKLESKQVPKTPVLLFLTADGLRDMDNRPVGRAPKGVKVYLGFDPRDV